MKRVRTRLAAEQSTNWPRAKGKPQQTPARAALRAWAAVLVTVASVGLLVANTNLTEIRTAAQEANYGLLGLALGVSGLSVIAKALRWRVLYPIVARPSVALAVAGVAAGQVANWAVPFRAGEALRVGLVGSATPAEGGGATRAVAVSVGVLVAEKLLDGVLLLVTVAVLVMLVGVPGWLSATALVFALGSCALGFALAVRLRRRPRIGWLGTVRSKLNPWLPTRISFVLEDAAGLGDGLSAWLSRSSAVQAISWSVAAWALGALVNYIVLRSVGLDPRQTVAATLAVLAALYGAAVVPALPGRLGVFQYLSVAALTPFGVIFNQALAFSLALYLAVYLPPILIALVSAILMGEAAVKPWVTTRHARRTG